MLLRRLLIEAIPYRIYSTSNLSIWTSWYRVAKTHRMPCFAGHCSQKSPIFSGSFVENDRIYSTTSNLSIWISKCRVAKTHRIPYLDWSFSAKVTQFSGSFAGNDLQIRASCESLPLCTREHNYRKSPIFRKSDLYLVGLLWKMICNLGDPMCLRPLVLECATMGSRLFWRYRIFESEYIEVWCRLHWTSNILDIEDYWYRIYSTAQLSIVAYFRYWIFDIPVHWGLMSITLDIKYSRFRNILMSNIWYQYRLWHREYSMSNVIDIKPQYTSIRIIDIEVHWGLMSITLDVEYSRYQSLYWYHIFDINILRYREYLMSITLDIEYSRYQSLYWYQIYSTAQLSVVACFRIFKSIYIEVWCRLH